MLNKNLDLFDRIKTAPIQAATVGVLVLSVACVLKLLMMLHVIGVQDPILFWVIGGAGMLFYAMMNSVVSLTAIDMNKYWFSSTLSYAALAALCGLMAYLFSGVAIGSAGSFKWIFFVLTFGYLLFLSLMRFVRKIVQVAQQEDNKWEERMK